MQKLYSQKDQIREEYYKNKLEYEIEKDEIFHYEWMAKEKQRLVDREKQKTERIEARK